MGPYLYQRKARGFSKTQKMIRLWESLQDFLETRIHHQM